MDIESLFFLVVCVVVVIGVVFTIFYDYKTYYEDLKEFDEGRDDHSQPHDFRGR